MNWYEHEREYYAPRPRFRFGPKLTQTVKVLIIINVVAFIVTALPLKRALMQYSDSGTVSWPIQLCLVPHFLFRKVSLWQLLTHMFMHGGVLHILMNMFVLWMFGSEMEARLGRKQFLQLYFLSGIGAGLCHALASWNSPVPMLGASGAVLGVLIAYAMLFPERYITLLLFFVLPVTVKAKHMVLGFALLTILSVITATGQDVAHFAHLGGFFFGYIYMKAKFRLGLPYAFSRRLADGLKTPWRSTRRWKHKYRPIDTEEFIDREVDPILAKISRYGMSSLTRREKKILKKARSQMK